MRSRSLAAVAAQAEVRLAIEDALDDGLPHACSPDLYQRKVAAVFEHVLESYHGDGGPSPLRTKIERSLLPFLCIPAVTSGADLQSVSSRMPASPWRIFCASGEAWSIRMTNEVRPCFSSRSLSGMPPTTLVSYSGIYDTLLLTNSPR